METNEIKEYRILYSEGDEIKDNGTRWETFDQLREDFPGPRWAIIPVNEVPENWRDMTIVDGKLVSVSAEILEARKAARQAAELEAIRAARESRYRAETDPIMLDAIEAYAVAHPEDKTFASWLSAKNAIRAQLPKPIIKDNE